MELTAEGTNNVPDVKALVQELIRNLFISTYNSQVSLPFYFCLQFSCQNGGQYNLLSRCVAFRRNPSTGGFSLCGLSLLGLICGLIFCYAASVYVHYHANTFVCCGE